MNVKAILVGLIFAPVVTFAANPPQCMPPAFLQLAAQMNQFHSFENVKSCKDVKLNQWYLDDSAESGSYTKEMQALTKYNDWQVGSGGGSGPYSVKCDYYSPSMPAADNHILMEKIFSKKICVKK